MEVVTYFFDSYAFFELIQGNQNYTPYTEHIAIVTTKLNLMELHYGLLKRFNKQVADNYFDELSQFTIEIDDSVFKQASEFRFLHKNKDLSYVDAIGYILSKMRGIKFLTGDRQFEKLDNVEFVK